MTKGKAMKTIAIVAALLLTGMAVPAFGQVAQLPNTTIPTQCIDLNQDRICEAVVIANGTMINFTKPTTAPTPEKKIVLPPWCEGLTLSRCPPPGPAGNELPTSTATITTWTDPNTGLVYDIPTEGYYCLDFDNDYICDVDFNNGKMVIYGESAADQQAATVTEEPAVKESGNNNDDNNGGDDRPNPYCDLVSDDYSGGCHDRRDYYDGGPKDGLYPCNDGTDKTDWRDCKDASGYDYNNDDSNDEEDNDKDNDGTDDDAPRELEEGEEVHVGEAVQGYEEDDGELDEDEDSVPLG